MAILRICPACRKPLNLLRKIAWPVGGGKLHFGRGASPRQERPAEELRVAPCRTRGGAGGHVGSRTDERRKGNDARVLSIGCRSMWCGSGGGCVAGDGADDGARGERARESGIRNRHC